MKGIARGEQKTVPSVRAFLGASLLLASFPAAGQETLANPEAFLQRGSRAFEVYGTAGQGVHQELYRDQGFDEFGTLAVVAARGISRRAEALLDFHPLILIRQPVSHAHGPRETVVAFAVDIGARWFPGSANKEWRPYAEILAGPFFALDSVPGRGTRFNFLLQGGFGLLWTRPAPWRPYASFHWVHISNGGIGPHNPSWDHWAISFGARLTLASRRR